MPDVPVVSRTSELTPLVSRAFADEGRLAASLEGYEPRRTQQEMAEAVAATFEAGGVLLAEAATGTGKTLAYLVPAILSRRRVLVSTGTKNLQEQIYFKDLPLLRDALGVPFTATFMKGRGNFLCLHRFDAFKMAGIVRSMEDVAHLRAIESWAPQTETGDRAELETLPEDLSFWPEIAATSEQCLGKECPQYTECFVTRMRQRAAESDIVIVNHHLLCADASVRQDAYGEVIPECHYAIIDEAHQLEDVATQYFGVAVSTYRLDEIVRDAHRTLDREAVPDRAQRDELRRLVDQVEDHAGVFFRTLGMLRRPSFGSSSDERVRITSRTLESTLPAGEALRTALSGVEGAVGLLKDAPEDARAIGRRAVELRDDLAFLQRASDPEYVYYLESRGRGVFLRASPIDVSRIVRDLLINRAGATILTSATLAVDGSFNYIKSRLGVTGAREICLASEFDFDRQAILYLPRSMPEPQAPGFAAAAAREVLSLLECSEGRAFVLFTSYANMRLVQGLVAPALSYPVLVQGQAPRSALLRQFRTTAHAVLFATSSFWQGVDVIGEALSCVIIDKLPFASPSDPVTAARIEHIRARGGDPFGEYQVPLAVLALQQGIGRLIRHRQDRGVLAILDPRIRTKAYGSRFLRSLPPARLTDDLHAVSRFFQA